MVWMVNSIDILILSPSNIENKEVRERILANPFGGQKGSAGVLLYEHKHTINTCSTSHSRAATTWELLLYESFMIIKIHLYDYIYHLGC